MRCNREAPGLEQFARDNQNTVKFVALGNQNSVDDAHGFMDRHHLTFPSYWEEGYSTWQAMGIQRQPEAVLVAPDGTELGRWKGEMNAERRAEVLKLAQQA